MLTGSYAIHDNNEVRVSQEPLPLIERTESVRKTHPLALADDIGPYYLVHQWFGKYACLTAAHSEHLEHCRVNIMCGLQL